MKKNNALPRLLILGLMILAVIAIPTGQASAAMVKCRTDPKFYLSNGDKVTIVLDIDAAESDVLYADYVLHVPAGVTVEHVVFTAGGIGQYESYSVLDDGALDIYTAEVLVMTRGSSVPVVVTTSARGGQEYAFSGMSAQAIPVTLQISEKIRNN